MCQVHSWSLQHTEEEVHMTQVHTTQLTVLYSFFWVIPRRLSFMCRHFGTLCLFRIHGWCKHTTIFITYEDGTDSVPKRRHIKFRRRGITQKKKERTFRTRRKFEIKKMKINKNVYGHKQEQHMWTEVLPQLLQIFDVQVNVHRDIFL